MNYLKFATVKEAEQRSRTEWVAVLGRAKNPEDVTEFLWSVTAHPKDGSAIMAVDDATQARLKSDEKASLLAADHPDVKAVFDAITAKAPSSGDDKARSYSQIDATAP